MNVKLWHIFLDTARWPLFNGGVEEVEATLNFKKELICQARQQRRGQTLKGPNRIHLLTSSRCAWLMSSSFGGEHMSTAAAPPSIGSDCVLANCIPGSRANSEPSELSRFSEKRASSFHLFHMLGSLYTKLEAIHSGQSSTRCLGHAFIWAKNADED